MWDVTPDSFMGGSSNSRSAPEGKATWAYDGEQWVLKSVETQNGGVAGPPPSSPGRFKGQLRVTPCVART